MRPTFGLRARILVSLAVVTLGGVASVGVIAIWQTKQVLASDRLERAQRLGETAARLAEAALDPAAAATSAPNRARLVQVAAAVVRAAEAKELVFFDSAGARVAQAGGAAPPGPAETDARGVAAAAAGVPPHAEERRGDGGLELVVYARVGEGAHPVVARSTFAVDAALDATLDRTRLTLLWLGAVDGLLLLVLAAWMLRGAVVRPVLALERAARRVADGDLSARAEARGPGELALLADAFDRMTESLRAGRESLIRSERLAGVGRLAAGVAHEVGNPLAAILGYVEMLRDDRPGKALAPEVARDMLARVGAETERIHRIIQDLLEYARPPRDEPEAVDVRRVIDAALGLVKAQSRLRDVRAEVDVPADLPAARATSGRLTQVVLNLLLNAADAVGGTGRVRVRARAAPDGVRIVVADDGPGVAPEDRARVFDPFFSTKPPGQGTGLGLSVSLAIVEGYGGTLRLVDDGDLGGACFEVTLPAVSPAPSRTA